MEKRNILIISRSFYPMISPRSFRTTELVKEFCRMGHKVVLITHFIPELHDELKQKYGFDIISLGQPLERVSKSKKGVLGKFKYFYFRILSIFIEYPNIILMFRLKNILKDIGKYDLAISIAVPHSLHWGVAWAKTKKNPIAKIWVADCGDAFMFNNLDTFSKPYYFKYLEKWFCRKANYISIPKINMSQNYYPEFLNKIIEIRQGFNFQEAHCNLVKYERNLIPTFAFSGSFLFDRGGRDPRPFIEYLLRANIDYKFYIFTTMGDPINDLVMKSKGKIEIKKYIPREELLKFLSSMDFLVNIAYDPATQSPSKLIDYHLSQRPILNIYDDQLNNEIILNINEFLNFDFSNHFTFDDIEKFNINFVANQFLELD